MSILNPDYNPQIELVDFGSEAFIEATELPCKQLVTSYQCPKGFAADQELLLKYSQLAFSKYCVVRHATLTTSGVTLIVIYNGERYEVTVHAWDFGLLSHATKIFSKTIASELVPVGLTYKLPTSKLVFVDIK